MTHQIKPVMWLPENRWNPNVESESDILKDILPLRIRDSRQLSDGFIAGSELKPGDELSEVTDFVCVSGQHFSLSFSTVWFCHKLHLAISENGK